MTKRDNLISLFKRKGYNEAPVDFVLCPSLYNDYFQQFDAADYTDYFGFPWKTVNGLKFVNQNTPDFRAFYREELKAGTYFDLWGVAHEPGSEAAMHMTKMHHPLAGADSLEQLKEYPFPDFTQTDAGHQKTEVEEIHKKGLAAKGSMEITIWETAWYLRSMEELFIDMMQENEMAEYLFDKVTEAACINAKAYAQAGVDIIEVGDDIGMQRNIMMSEELYRSWIKPRLKKVINIARSINPEILIKYHSCGYVKPFINDLIEIGVDILNPVQPECMEFKEIHSEFGDRVSFHGTVGTQTTMPFGSVDDVKNEVHRNLKIAGPKGGLFCAPTHLLEPEVPLANVLAYVEACKNFN